MFDPVAELGVAVKEVAAERRDGWSGLALSDRVAGVAAESERLQVQVVRALAQWDGAAAWAEDGFLSPVGWLCQHLPVTEGEARSLVKVAGLYRRYPAVAAALEGGEIAMAHARVLQRAEHGHEQAFDACVDGLVDLARDHPLLKDFAQVMNEWAKLVDEREPADDSKRAFRSSDTFGGHAHTEMSGPSDDAAIMRAAIEALDTPDAPDCPEGPRTRVQRHYDIVMDIFRRQLADALGADPDSTGTADVVLDADTAAALMADPDGEQGALDLDDDPDPIDDFFDRHRNHDHDHDHECDRHPSSGDAGLGDDHGGCCHDRVAHGGPHCELSAGARVTLTFAAVLLCTGWVRRLTRDPVTGNIVDLGRRQRLFSRAQRRALVYRDRGCVFPGCDRGPKWCDGHHLKPWEDGGLTDLINGVLLCRRHHRLVHRGWRLERDHLTGIVTATSPDGRTFHRQPDSPLSPHVRC